MPIKALKPRLVESGKIKIGGKSTEGRPKKRGKGKWYPPVKYDEFHVTTMNKDRQRDTFLDDVPLMWLLREYNATPELREKADAAPNTKAKAEILKGVKIRRIPVVLHSDRMDDVLEHDLTCYIGKQRHKVCDGETCTLYEVREGPEGAVSTGRSKQVSCECPKSPKTSDNPHGFVSPRFWDGKTPKRKDLICKPTGILRCMIAIDRAGTGIYTFRSTGWQSLSALLGALERLESDCGRIANIPCELVMFQGTGKDAQGRRTKVWAVNLRPMQSVRQRLVELKELQSMRAFVTQLPPTRRAIAAEGVAPQEGDFGPEFFPERETPEPEEEIKDAEYEERDDGPFPEPEPSACVDCGEVTGKLVHGNDNRLRCPSCHNEWASEASGVESPHTPAEERQPGEDRGEDDPPPPDPTGDGADTQAGHPPPGHLERLVAQLWREYSDLTEHPDGAGALYRAVCEAAGFDGVLHIESAPLEQLVKLKEFFLDGIAKLKQHEPTPAFEDDLPFD